MAGGAFDAGARITAANNPLITGLQSIRLDPDILLKAAEDFLNTITQILEQTVVAVIKDITGIDLTSLTSLISGDFLDELLTGDFFGVFSTALGAVTGLGANLNFLNFLPNLATMFSGLGLNLTGGTQGDFLGGLVQDLLLPLNIFATIGQDGLLLVEQAPAILFQLIDNVSGLFGGIDLTGNPLDIPAEILNFVTNVLTPTGLLASAEDLFNLSGEVALLEGLVDGVLEAIPGGVLIQPLVDMIFNALTNSNATDVPLGLIGQEIRALKNVAATAGELATQAFEVTQSFGGLLHQLIEDLPIVPIYQGFEDFLANMFNVLATTVGNIFQSLSPSNPGTAVNSNQIAALWAHVSASNTAGIHYSFSPSVALTANYQGTTNPAWSPAGPLTMPSVFPNSNYVYSTLNTQGMVFTGNPNGAVTGDHGLVTDKNQVYNTVGSLAFGTEVLFISGNYVSGTLHQNVELELGYGGPSALRLYTCTGANSGRTQQTLTMADGVTTNTQYDIPSGGVKLNDVWGLQFDGVRTYTIYYNNMAVATWADSATTPILTHGAGYRECGLIPTNTGGSFIGMAEFTALDYV